MSRQSLAGFATVVALMATASVIVAGQAPDGWTVPRTPDGRPDLNGIWANDSATPLQRPEALGDRTTLTDEEVVALETFATEAHNDGGDAAFGDSIYLRALASLDAPTDQPAAPRPPFWSYGQQWMGNRWFDNRTSLIIDPPNGRLPPRSAEAQERAERQRAARNTPAPAGFQNVSEELDRLDPGVRCRGGRSGFFVATHRPSSAMYRQWSCGGHHASITHAQQS